MVDGRGVRVCGERRICGLLSGRVYWVDALILQLLLEALDVLAQAGVLALEVLRMTTGAGEACDAICCTTLGVVLGARRAAAGLGIAADLPELWEEELEGGFNGVSD